MNTLSSAPVRVQILPPVPLEGPEELLPGPEKAGDERISAPFIQSGTGLLTPPPGTFEAFHQEMQRRVSFLIQAGRASAS